MQSVSWGWISDNNCMCCYTAIQAEDKTLLTSLCFDPVTLMHLFSLPRMQREGVEMTVKRKRERLKERGKGKGWADLD